MIATEYRTLIDALNCAPAGRPFVTAWLDEDMRETVALRGEVAAVAAHGKLTGAILTAMPFAIAGMMMVVNPGYMATLVQHPWGKDMIWAAIGFLVLGHFAIRRIVAVRM